MLRRAGEATTESTRRISLGDLLNGEVVAAGEEAKFATIRVHRPAKKDDYSVPVEKDNGLTSVGRRRQQ